MHILANLQAKPPQTQTPSLQMKTLASILTFQTAVDHHINTGSHT
jgi:hypothetical protein